MPLLEACRWWRSNDRLQKGRSEIFVIEPGQRSVIGTKAASRCSAQGLLVLAASSKRAPSLNGQAERVMRHCSSAPTSAGAPGASSTVATNS